MPFSDLLWWSNQSQEIALDLNLTGTACIKCWMLVLLYVCLVSNIESVFVWFLLIVFVFVSCFSFSKLDFSERSFGVRREVVGFAIWKYLMCGLSTTYWARRNNPQTNFVQCSVNFSRDRRCFGHVVLLPSLEAGGTGLCFDRMPMWGP